MPPLSERTECGSCTRRKLTSSKTNIHTGCSFANSKANGLWFVTNTTVAMLVTTAKLPSRSNHRNHVPAARHTQPEHTCQIVLVAHPRASRTDIFGTSGVRPRAVLVQLEAINAKLHVVGHERQHRSQRECDDKQRDITKLDHCGPPACAK